MHWLSIIGLCLIVLGTIFSFFGTYFSDQKSQNELSTKIQEKNKTIDEINNNNIKLIDQNAVLVSSSESLSNTNKNLIDQSGNLLTKIEKYQNDIEIRNKQIENLEQRISDIKEYSYYANLDLFGRPFTPGDGIKINSDLSDRMEKLFIQVGNEFYPENNLNNIPSIDKVIEDYPNFPFIYHVKAIVLKAHNDEAWRNYATRAVEIFTITTSIQGHHSSHDQAMNILQREMATNR